MDTNPDDSDVGTGRKESKEAIKTMKNMLTVKEKTGLSHQRTKTRNWMEKP